MLSTDCLMEQIGDNVFNNEYRLIQNLLQNHKKSVKMTLNAYFAMQS